MTEDDNHEDDIDDPISDEEWDAFWKSLNNYQTAIQLRDEVFRQANEVWADVSPRFNASEEAFIVVQNGEFRANMAGHVLVTAMANATFRTTLNAIFNENVLSQLSEELQSQIEDSDKDLTEHIRPEKQCPDCGTVFDPQMQTCPECGKEF